MQHIHHFTSELSECMYANFNFFVSTRLNVDPTLQECELVDERAETN